MADIYDEMINEYNARKTQTQTDINNLATEKQNVLDTYEQQYNQQLTDYNNLMNQQQANIDTWANTAKETQQKQTDYNLGLIEQAKKETEKETNAERGNAYIDYQKGLNQFGGSAETLASQGLSGTGFAKNQEIAMNITYQNRLAAANTALQKANTDYNNQMQQALLNNDAALAEIALQQLEKSYALALQGFEYKTTLQNNRLTYIQNVNDTYFSKTNTLQGRLDDYTDKINSVKSAQEQARQQAAAASSSRYYSSKSSGGGNNNQLAFSGNNEKQNTPVNNSATTDFVARTLGAINNALTPSTYTANMNPKLSGRNASTWYNNNIAGKSLTASKLNSLLDTAYKAGLITTQDKKNIKSAFGVK